ncbi:hypothetical protein R1sor_004759 [Riccia sorocarpa]|uniref:Uncharacterized protein n=1 Tax=Riccia sorocarpa TaxID=122646 RepID=A0ABD3HI72_9MARC
MEGTVSSRTVRLDAASICEAFLLPATSLEIKRQVRHSLIRDWFPDYERSEKRYIARTCRHRGWAPTLECISMMLLAGRRPRTILGRLVYYIKHFKLDSQDEPEQRLDFADLMAHNLRREVFTVQAHLTDNKPERYIETFVAISLTRILIHLEIITSEECDAPPTAPTSPADLLVWGGDRVEAVHPLNNPDKHVKLKSFRRLHDQGICLRSMDGVLDPILVLREFWAEPPQPVNRYIIWSDVPSATRRDLLAEIIEEAPAEEATLVEEAPAEEMTPVEEAPASEETPVEEAPVDETTRVEKAPAEEGTLVDEIPLAIPIPVEAIPLGVTQE